MNVQLSTKAVCQFVECSELSDFVATHGLSQDQTDQLKQRCHEYQAKDLGNLCVMSDSPVVDENGFQAHA